MALEDELLRPLVTRWLELINKGIEHRSQWSDVADQCEGFFSGSVGFMFDDKFRRKYIKGNLKPKFRITLNKAFELVALFGPMMYERNPTRSVRPYPKMEFEPDMVAEALGIDPQQLEQLGQAHQQLQQMQQAAQQGTVLPPPPPALVQQAQAFLQIQQQIQSLQTGDARQRQRTETACKLMETYLDYTPREQPDGGLKQASEDAITEALITGRGVLWPETYMMPGSNTLLTGSFYDTTRNLITDPDATCFNFGNTRWIARRRVNTQAELEEKFNLPREALKDRAGGLESADAQASRQTDPLGHMHRAEGDTFDLVTWYELYSIAGLGTRLKDVRHDFAEELEEVCGDFCYMALADGIPWPLNAPPEKVRKATDEELRRMLSWPIPYWLDQRWPCAVLDFYRIPNSPWPLAPMAPGLGELVFLNVMMSHLTNRIWNSSRTFMAVLKTASENVRQIMDRGEDLAVFELSNVSKSINDVVSFLKQPDVTFDVWKIIDRMFELFDKRVGLTELLYALNPGGAASRTASDITVKAEKASIRPDFMANKVEDWMTEVARLEKICAYHGGVKGEAMRPLLGTVGALLWDRLIANGNPEIIHREMDCTIEAASARKPNKARDAANMQQIYPALSQQLGSYAQDTGDTEPLNNLNKRLGRTLDMDMSGLEMKPRPAPGSGEQEAAAQAAQAEQQMKQQELQLDAQKQQQELELKQRDQEQQLASDQDSHDQDIDQSDEQHDQQLRHAEETHDLGLDLEEEKAQVQRRLLRIKAAQIPTQSSTPKKQAK